MTTPAPTYELDIENPDAELTDQAIESLAALLVDAALREIKEDSEVAA